MFRLGHVEKRLGFCPVLLGVLDIEKERAFLFPEVLPDLLAFRRDLLVDATGAENHDFVIVEQRNEVRDLAYIGCRPIVSRVNAGIHALVPLVHYDQLTGSGCYGGDIVVVQGIAEPDDTFLPFEELKRQPPVCAMILAAL